MMIRVEQRLTVAAFLAEVRRRYRGPEGLRRYTRRHPRDVAAALDLEEFEYYVDRPELAASAMDRAISLIPVTEGALGAFTKQRLALLDALAVGSYGSVRELARALGRDVHNVSEDLRLFRGLGLVDFDRGSRNRRAPRLVGHAIRIDFGSPARDDRPRRGRGRRTLEPDRHVPVDRV